jgi:RNA polymerase sigma-70 factor, ECF subfamily
MSNQIEAIWTDLHHELRKFIFNKVGDNHISEDILQEVFLKIQLNLHTLKDSSKLTSWAYQITRNTIIDHYRKSSSKPLPIDIDLAPLEIDEPAYLSLSNCINLKITKLSKEYKEALLLTYFDNLSQMDIAKKLDISYSGTKTRVQRGREKLKNLIGDCPNVITDSNGKFIEFNNAE